MAKAPDLEVEVIEARAELTWPETDEAEAEAALLYVSWGLPSSVDAGADSRGGRGRRGGGARGHGRRGGRGAAAFRQPVSSCALRLREPQISHLVEEAIIEEEDTAATEPLELAPDMELLPDEAERHEDEAPCWTCTARQQTLIVYSLGKQRTESCELYWLVPVASVTLMLTLVPVLASASSQLSISPACRQDCEYVPTWMLTVQVYELPWTLFAMKAMAAAEG